MAAFEDACMEFNIARVYLVVKRDTLLFDLP